MPEKQQEKSYHEIIKVPAKTLAWVYVHSKNVIDIVPPHWHRDLEVTCMLKGSADYHINGRRQILHAGDILIINDGVIHSCTMDTTKDDAISIIFPYDFITQFQKNTGYVFFELNKKSAAYLRLKQSFGELYRIVLRENEDPFALLDANQVLYAIASVLFHDCRFLVHQADTFRTDRNQKRAQAMADYIDEHYAEKLTLKDMAERYAITNEHFSRTFCNYMGISFKNYLTRIRMHHAYQDLINTDYNILEIALKNGFSDSRAFIANFHEEYGATPKQYRKLRENPKKTLEIAVKKDRFLLADPFSPI